MRMPAIFIGHGSPMNAIEDNHFTDEWEKIGKVFKPKGIVMISAHWYTQGTLTQTDEYPKKINDMYGFPSELYTMTYPVKGSFELTQEIKHALGDIVKEDHTWGIDHGAWSVLVHMYPNADVPVVQVSVDSTKEPKEHFEIGQKIGRLREEGYMIIGSGNIVHNLGRINLSSNEPYLWAASFDDYIEEAIGNKHFDMCLNYLDFGESAKLSVPTTEHYYPLLTILGAAKSGDQMTVFNKGYCMGSLSMTGYIFR